MATLRKNILITGASSGLGEEMARQFAARNRNLALCARRTDRLESLRAELLAKHPTLRVWIKPLDVNDDAQVFAVFRAFAEEMGQVDRIIVNAGIGKGEVIGTGHFAANKAILQTNLVAALAQCEAAMEIFRKQNAGHLVVISSVSAVRGLPRTMTTYAASKAGVASLAEGIRGTYLHTPIRVTTLFPGYIRSEINETIHTKPFVVDTPVGCRAMVKVIERESDEGYVPLWPWAWLRYLMQCLPLRMIARAV